MIENRWWYMLFVPLLLILVNVFLSNPKDLFFLTFLLIPFSIETELPGGIGFDAPTEALLWLLTGYGIFYYTKNPKKHMLSGVGGLFVLQLCWFMVTALFAFYPVLALKFVLAKSWYIIPFYLLPAYVIKKQTRFNTLLKGFLISVLLAGLYTFVHHGMSGWTFDSRTNTGAPIFRNHVNYACLLLLALPACYYLYTEEKKKWFILLGIMLLVFLYFTYARIAYVAVLFSGIGLLLLKRGLFRSALFTTILFICIALVFISSKDRWLMLAPDYERTISHKQFDRLVEATYRLEDISAMERVHRWVAGMNMVKERPWTGVGPMNFYSTYQPYTINSFQTYVSDNPEKSGIHNYFLMTAAEQGLPGLFLLLVIIIYLVIRATKDYSKVQSSRKHILELAILWMVILLVINMMNDMLEVIKVGPFFFLAAYLIQDIDHGIKEWKEDTADG